MLGSEFRSCGKVKVAVLGSLSLISLVVSVDIKQHCKQCWVQSSGAVGRSRWPSWAPCLVFLISLVGFFGHKATFEEAEDQNNALACLL